MQIIFILIIGIIIYAALECYVFPKNNNYSNGSSLQPISQPSINVGPSSDVLECIELYKEIKTSNYRIDQNERIRRCNNILTDFEWYTNCKNPSRFNSQPQANWHALWNAICEYDTVYEGDRYRMDMMSNICLEIIEKNSNY